MNPDKNQFEEFIRHMPDGSRQYRLGAVTVEEAFAQSEVFDPKLGRHLTEFEALADREHVENRGVLLLNSNGLSDPVAAEENSALKKSEASPETKASKFLITVIAHRPPEA